MRISDWSSDVCSSDLGQAELQAIVLIGDPKAMANGLIAVGNRNRVLLGIGEVNDRRPEYGPEARDLQPAAKPDFFPVLQILQIRQTGRASCRERVCQVV